MLGVENLSRTAEDQVDALERRHWCPGELVLKEQRPGGAEFRRMRGTPGIEEAGRQQIHSGRGVIGPKIGIRIEITGKDDRLGRRTEGGDQLVGLRYLDCCRRRVRGHGFQVRGHESEPGSAHLDLGRDKTARIGYGAQDRVGDTEDGRISLCLYV